MMMNPKYIITVKCTICNKIFKTPQALQNVPCSCGGRIDVQASDNYEAGWRKAIKKQQDSFKK